MDNKEKKFFTRVVYFLEHNMSFDTTQDIYTLNSGDNSVIMRGEFAGYSLGELKEYAAKQLNKSVKWEYD